MKETDLIISVKYKPLKVRKLLTPESWNYNANVRIKVLCLNRGLAFQLKYSIVSHGK